MSKSKKLEQMNRGVKQRRREPQPQRLKAPRRIREKLYDTVTASLFPVEREALGKFVDTLRKQEQDPNFAWTRSHVLRHAILQLNRQLSDKKAEEIYETFKKWEAEATTERHK